MVAPYDYSLGLPSATDALMSGINTGANIANQRERIETANLNQQITQQKIAQQEQAMTRQQDLAAQVRTLMASKSPNARDFANVAMLLPEKEAESMRKNWELLSKDQQTSDLNFSGQVMAAFNSDKPEIGVDLLRQRADAERNANNPDKAKALDTWAQIAEANPAMAGRSIGVLVAGLPGGDKVIESVTKLGAERRAEALQPSELSVKQSLAQKAAIDAKFAESQAVIDLQKKGWDITKIQEDIAVQKRNSQIAAMNAAVAREGNALKREELQLKVGEMREKRDETVRARVSDATSARSSIDNMLNTVDKVLLTPIGVMKAAMGPLDSRLPTLQGDVADFEANVDTLKSQAFLAMVPQMTGKGALSDSEGKRLESALRSFSLTQSPTQFTENMREAQRLLIKGRSNLTTKYGVPETVPDTPSAAASMSTGDINALLKKYGPK